MNLSTKKDCFDEFLSEHTQMWMKLSNQYQDHPFDRNKFVMD